MFVFLLTGNDHDINDNQCIYKELVCVITELFLSEMAEGVQQLLRVKVARVDRIPR